MIDVKVVCESGVLEQIDWKYLEMSTVLCLSRKQERRNDLEEMMPLALLQAFDNLPRNLQLQKLGSPCSTCSSNKLADTTGSLDALDGARGEQFGADDAWNLCEFTLSADLEEAL